MTTELCWIDNFSHCKKGHFPGWNLCHLWKTIMALGSMHETGRYTDLRRHDSILEDHRPHKRPAFGLTRHLEKLLRMYMSDQPDWVHISRPWLDESVGTSHTPGSVGRLAVDDCPVVRQLIKHMCKDWYWVPPAREVSFILLEHSFLACHWFFNRYTVNRREPSTTGLSEIKIQEFTLFYKLFTLHLFLAEYWRTKWEMRLERKNYPRGLNPGPHLGALGNLRVERAKNNVTADCNPGKSASWASKKASW